MNFHTILHSSLIFSLCVTLVPVQKMHAANTMQKALTFTAATTTAILAGNFIVRDNKDGKALDLLKGLLVLSTGLGIMAVLNPRESRKIIDGMLGVSRFDRAERSARELVNDGKRGVLALRNWLEGRT